MPNNLHPTQFLLYKSENGRIKVDVLVQDETVWLTQEQMAQLEKKSNVQNLHIPSYGDR